MRAACRRRRGDAKRFERDPAIAGQCASTVNPSVES
jgi:hypothetical protein